MKFRIKKSTLVPLLSALLLLILLGIAITSFLQQAHVATNQVIIKHIAILEPIFKSIHAKCTILGFKHEYNYIDFLTVNSFVSSDVGAMHLMYPEQWKGPYLQENLTVQGILYEIVKTKGGYYIVPGKGVKLANGKIIGKDIIFTNTTDIDALINETVGLKYQHKPLAVHIDTNSTTAAIALEGIMTGEDE